MLVFRHSLSHFILPVCNCIKTVWNWVVKSSTTNTTLAALRFCTEKEVNAKFKLSSGELERNLDIFVGHFIVDKLIISFEIL